MAAARGDRRPTTTCVKSPIRSAIASPAAGPPGWASGPRPAVPPLAAAHSTRRCGAGQWLPHATTRLCWEAPVDDGMCGSSQRSVVEPTSDEGSSRSAAGVIQMTFAL